MKTITQLREGNPGDPSRYPVKTQARDPAVKFWADRKKTADTQRTSQTNLYRGTKQQVPPASTISDYIGLMMARAVGGKKLVPDVPDTNYVKTIPIKAKSK